MLDSDAEVVRIVEDATDVLPCPLEAVIVWFIIGNGINPSGPKAKGNPEVFGIWQAEVVALFVAVTVQPETVLQVVVQLMLVPE